MVKATAMVGSNIVHPTRPTIKHLIGQEVKVAHVTEGHGEWKGKLQHRYLSDTEKAENFVYFVEGTPCPHCNKYCTKQEETGCKEWQATQKLTGNELKDSLLHSSQPELLFDAHTVYRIDGKLIVLG